jgi:hypothetical protein
VVSQQPRKEAQLSQPEETSDAMKDQIQRGVPAESQFRPIAALFSEISIHPSDIPKAASILSLCGDRDPETFEEHHSQVSFAIQDAANLAQIEPVPGGHRKWGS